MHMNWPIGKYLVYVLHFLANHERTGRRAMKTALEFVILCNNRWPKIKVAACQKGCFRGSVTEIYLPVIQSICTMYTRHIPLFPHDRPALTLDGLKTSHLYVVWFLFSMGLQFEWPIVWRISYSLGLSTTCGLFKSLAVFNFKSTYPPRQESPAKKRYCNVTWAVRGSK